MSRFMNPRYADLEAYTPGEQPKDRAYIKLNTNESPYPPSPEVLAAARQCDDLRLYPDPEGRALTSALATFYQLSPQQVFLSNGSDDILNFAFMAFGGAGATFPAITYSFYPVYGALHHVPCQQIPLQNDFSIRPSDFYDKNTLILIANPNAPTGMALDRQSLREILTRNPHSVVLIDEAYVDFGAESAVPLLSEFSNLLVVMTYSKSRSLAGARLGFALGSPELIADLNQLKFSTNPYNVNRLTLNMGVAAVASDAYFRERCQKIIATREDTVKALDRLGFTSLPSLANFIFTRRDGLSGLRLYEDLKARGILIRHFNKKNISDFIRVTIGTPEDMATFIQAVTDILNKEGF